MPRELVYIFHEIDGALKSLIKRAQRHADKIRSDETHKSPFNKTDLASLQQLIDQLSLSGQASINNDLFQLSSLKRNQIQKSIKVWSIAARTLAVYQTYLLEPLKVSNSVMKMLLKPGFEKLVPKIKNGALTILELQEIS